MFDAYRTRFQIEFCYRDSKQVYGTYGLSGKTQEPIGLCVQRIIRLTECRQGLHERQWYGQFHGKS